MLRDTYKELPRFVELMAEVGVDEVRLSNLSYVPHPDFWNYKIYAKMFEPEPADVLKAVEEAKEVAKKWGIKLTQGRFSPWEQPECPEVPTKTLFISVNGDVYPCVYLSLAGFPRCFEGKCHKIPALFFGNARSEKLCDIVKKRAYVEFVQKFEMRKRADLFLPDPPEVCKKCYRLYWI
ncbi:hypothetical protein Pogu_0960 [Pyrobaculum oguniense TE7]|uniref:4Fe4S-binding SPASM domain-containing protein n=1 Tax=Pyrobaculum oguniense (strain DSM 13380 / JCM 10595 / TE7) TaxID=698757 RepID=H6Q9S9_PYROT|nr:hypothetical protein Pogu_0960 [Pyrobaculum oguniense TE7]